LKDLEFWNVRTLSKMRMIEELKAEAVKWVKEKDGTQGNWKILLPAEASHFDEVQMVKRWIMHFFNLTEEDLKLTTNCGKLPKRKGELCGNSL
jgi:hypothetical protein